MFNPYTDRQNLTAALMPDTDEELHYLFGTTLILDLNWLIGLLCHLRDCRINKDSHVNFGQLMTVLEYFQPGAEHIPENSSAILDVFMHKDKFTGSQSVKPHSIKALAFEHALKFVHSIAPPVGGLFHPKIWLAYFRPRYGSATTRKHLRCKLIVSSSNAVHSNSLEGYISIQGGTNQKAKYGAESPNLVRFIEHCYKAGKAKMPVFLPELLRRTRFAGFTEEFFFFQGFGNRGLIQNLANDLSRINAGSIYIFSPFLNANAVRMISQECKLTLISNRAGLLEANSTGQGFANGENRKYYYVEGLSGESPAGEGDQAEHNNSDSEIQIAARNFEVPGFLHAKMYFLYAKSKALLYIGSANCTIGGLGIADGENNVECLVRYEIPVNSMTRLESGFIRNEASKIKGSDPKLLSGYLRDFDVNDQFSPEQLEECQIERRNQQTFENLLRLRWSAKYFKGTISLSAKKGFASLPDAVSVRLLKIGPMQSAPSKDSLEYRLDLKGKIVYPGTLFELVASFKNQPNKPYYSMIHLPIINLPKSLKQSLVAETENAIMNDPKSLMLYLLGTLYESEPYLRGTFERALTRESNRKSGREADLEFALNIEQLLLLGPQIKDQIMRLKPFLKKPKKGTSAHVITTNPALGRLSDLVDLIENALLNITPRTNPKQSKKNR